MELKQKIKDLPSTPGVYLYKDAQGGILYVGKAKNLKRRVTSYFQSSKSHSPKVEKLVKHLKDFDFILTDTEFEAFMLECKLIKELKPLYNRKMKTPQGYTYIGIQRAEKFPKLVITNEPKAKDCQSYYGPYTGKGMVEKALQGLKEYFKIVCNNPSLKKSACLNHSIGLCMGMCQGGAEVEEYLTIIKRIEDLLVGADFSILEELEQKMLAASGQFDFEAASKYRDYIESINFLLSKEKVIVFTEENHNIVIVEPLDKTSFKLFLIKGNKMLVSQTYIYESYNMESLRFSIKEEILEGFKATNLSGTLEVTKNDLDEAQIIYSYLQGNSCNYVIIPKKWLNKKDSTGLNKAIDKLLKSIEIGTPNKDKKTVP